MVQVASPHTIRQAAGILRQGGLVAFPTETVYGLGADAANPAAVARLYAVKGRPPGHPVIVHLAGAEQLEDWAREIPPAARLLAEAFWPGPLTLILPRSPGVPDAVTGGQDTVGLRVPAHPVARALLQEFGGGVAAPSANRFGRLSPTAAAHVQADLGGDIDCILDGGECAVGVESTIVAFPAGQPVILRPGMITAEQIEAVLSQAVQPPPASPAEAPRAPGTLASHYAPRTTLRLVPSESLASAVRAVLKEGSRPGVLARSAQPAALAGDLIWIQAEEDPDAYARHLYARLRQLDGMGLSVILVEAVPQTGAWAAVADRLGRAAAEFG